MSLAPYEKACEEAACGRRGNQSRSDAAAPAARPPPHERGQSRLLRRAPGEVEAEREAREPDHKTDCGADDRGCRTVGAGASCPDDNRGADQCGDRVQPLSEHDGDLADEDVAEDAAADARDRAEDDGGCGGEPSILVWKSPATAFGRSSW